MVVWGYRRNYSEIKWKSGNINSYHNSFLVIYELGNKLIPMARNPNLPEGVQEYITTRNLWITKAIGDEYPKL